MGTNGWLSCPCVAHVLPVVTPAAVGVKSGRAAVRPDPSWAFHLDRTSVHPPVAHWVGYTTREGRSQRQALAAAVTLIVSPLGFMETQQQSKPH